jgi:ribonuclease HI
VSRTCRICQQEQPNEAFSLRGHRVRICKKCKRLPHDQVHRIEALDEIAHFLTQSNISAKNVVRLETLTESGDTEVREWATAVLDVARRAPRKRKRYVRLTREAPDLLHRLRGLLGDEWWDDLVAHGVLGEEGEPENDDPAAVDPSVAKSNRGKPAQASRRGLLKQEAVSKPATDTLLDSSAVAPLPASHEKLKRVLIHTDGACQHNPGPGGWAAILRYGDRAKELKGSAASTTNNRMELQAAIAALAALKYRCAVEIVTDSKYLRDGVTRWVARWKANGWKTVERDPVKNRDLWEQLDAQCARHEVTWRWIRGHTGHPDNERCDALARAEIGRQLERDCPPQSPARVASNVGLV